MKRKADKSDTGKLETTSVDSSKVVRNHGVKKTEYNELVKKYQYYWY